MQEYVQTVKMPILINEGNMGMNRNIKGVTKRYKRAMQFPNVVKNSLRIPEINPRIKQPKNYLEMVN